MSNVGNCSLAFITSYSTRTQLGSAAAALGCDPFAESWEDVRKIQRERERERWGDLILVGWGGVGQE